MEQNNITIMEPKDADMVFLMGTNKTISYKIKNNDEFPIKDLELESFTVKNAGTKDKPSYISTSKNYSRIITAPEDLKAFQTKDVLIEINVPINYSETVTKNGKKTKVPFLIKFTMRGLEYIE